MLTLVLRTCKLYRQLKTRAFALGLAFHGSINHGFRLFWTRRLLVFDLLSDLLFTLFRLPAFGRIPT